VPWQHRVGAVAEVGREGSSRKDRLPDHRTARARVAQGDDGQSLREPRDQLDRPRRLGGEGQDGDPATRRAIQAVEDLP